MNGTVMQMVREKVTKSAAKAIEMFDYAAAFARRDSAAKPHIDREAHVMRTYNKWFDVEVRRPGSNVTSTAPEEVDRAINQARAALFNSTRKVYAEDEAAVRAEVTQLQEDAIGKLLIAADALVLFQARYSLARQFAMSCGAQPMPALPVFEFERYRVEDWAARMRQAINPPTPAPRIRPKDNPLKLD